MKKFFIALLCAILSIFIVMEVAYATLIDNNDGTLPKLEMTTQGSCGFRMQAQGERCIGTMP